MSDTQHDHAPLGAYVLGVLDRREVAAIERHLATCAECSREVAELAELRFEMDAVPPEAFLDGPPEGGDLLLRRTLREVRDEESRETARPAKRRRGGLVAVAAGLVLIALGGGIVLGRQTAPEERTIALPPPPPVASNVPGTRTLSASDTKTGAAMSVSLTPAAGWVRVHAAVQGVKQGEKCLLVVKSKQGEPMTAGSWLVSAQGEKQGTSLDGSALVAPDQVGSVDVVTTDGRTLVAASA